MGKPRRPRGPRFTWKPEPPLDTDVSAAADTPADPVLAAVPVAVPDDEPAPGAEASGPAETPAAVIEPHAQQAAADTRDGIAAVLPVAVAPQMVAPPARDRILFAPGRLDIIEIGSTIARYVRGEGEAAIAHLRALRDARSPADVIRLQAGEVQRAADASLSCWVTVVSKASRVVAFL
ncbi:hypothetical protein ACRAWG_07970 [Methylobacterium sp. P31]